MDNAEILNILLIKAVKIFNLGSLRLFLNFLIELVNLALFFSRQSEAGK